MRETLLHQVEQIVVLEDTPIDLLIVSVSDAFDLTLH
jgi:hypothetical protein